MKTSITSVKHDNFGDLLPGTVFEHKGCVCIKLLPGIAEGDALIISHLHSSPNNVPPGMPTLWEDEDLVRVVREINYVV